MSDSSIFTKVSAIVLTGAGVLGVAYGIAKYVTDFENAKAEIQNLRGQITQLHEVLAKTQSGGDNPRLDRLERQVAELMRSASVQAVPAAAAPVGDRLGQGSFEGTASDGKNIWPFRVTEVKTTGGNGFDALIEWPTLKSVHRIQGSYTSTSLAFKEVEYVTKGNNVIGCEYTLKTPREDGLAGTYRNCDGNAGGGTIEVDW